jgi:hypothetical protein
VFASLPRILRTLAHKAVRTDAEPLALAGIAEFARLHYIL